MAFQTLSQAVIASASRSGFRLNDYIHCRQPCAALTEVLTDNTFDPIAGRGRRDGLFGHRKPQSGCGLRVHRVDGETAIREANSLAEGSGKLRRGTQPGIGWKPGAGIA